jgi:WD40 repeat protein
MNTFAIDAYRECCDARGVRPNVQIMKQLKSPAAAVELPILDASSTFLGSLGVHAVLDFVHLHQGIRLLSLANNGVDASNVEHLCSVFACHQSLGACDLQSNNLATPSIRSLWELARHTNTVQRIGTDGTGIAEDWKQRLERALRSNEEYQVLGFHNYGADRPITQWDAAYVCVVGQPDQVAHLSDLVFPALNSLVSKMRLRVSPVVVTEADTETSMREKLSLCVDRTNGGRIWCVSFLSKKSPVHEVLRIVAEQSVLPDIPPLHNKLGEIRPPIYRAAKNMVVISEPLEHTRVRGNDEEEEAMAAFITQAQPFLNHPCAYKLETESRSSADLYILSSLYTSLKRVYSQDPGAHRVAGDYDWELADRLAPTGQMFPTELAGVLRYCEPSAATCAFPLVLYGSGSGGKDEILAAAACTLRNAPSGTVTVVPRKIVPYFVEEAPSRSVVLLLYFLLDVFCPSAASEVFPTLQEMMLRTRKCIENYCGEHEVALFLSGIEFLTYCDVLNGTISSLAWLPASFPSTVRIALTVRTESPLLLTLRSRSPLPFELLIGGLPMTQRLRHLRSMLAHRGISSPELGDDVIATINDQAVGARGNSVVDLLGAKEDTDLHLYLTALAAYIVSQGFDDIAGCIKAAPETAEGVFRSLLTGFEQRLGRKLVMSIVVALACSPLPATELVLVCETVLGCERYSTVPAVATLLRDGLLTSNGANVLRLANTVVCAAVKDQYASSLQETDEIASSVASHVHRLVVTRSPELLFSFRRVFTVLVQSCQDDIAEALLFDALLLDKVLQEDPLCRRTLVDAIFTITTYRARLEELYEGRYATCHFTHNPARRTLAHLLRDIQELPGTVFQGALLLSQDSPLRLNAAAREPPYLCLLPLNDGNEEGLSVYSVSAQAQLSHCNRFEDVLCATSPSQVLVCNAVTGAVIAKSVASPLGIEHKMYGSLVVSPKEIAVICRDQVALWNIEADTWTTVVDVTCSLSGFSFDSLRQFLLVVQPSTHHVSLLDLHRKKITFSYGEVFQTGCVREAKYLGSNVAVVSVYDIAIIRPSGERCVLSHPDIVRCVASSVDGKIIAAGVGLDVWLWTQTGQNLHICTGHSQNVTDVAFHPSGATVISCSADRTLTVWNTLTGKDKAVLRTDLREAADYAMFTPDGTKILARCGGYLRQWDPVTYQNAGAVNACAGHIGFFCLTNSAIAAVTENGSLKAWSLSQSFATVTQASELSLSTNISRNSKVVNNNNNATAVLDAVTCEGESVLCLSADGELRNWPLRGGSPLSVLSSVLCFTSTCVDDSTTRVVAFTTDLRLTVVDIPRAAAASGSVPSSIATFPVMRDVETNAAFALTAFADFSQVVLTMNCGAQSRLCLFDTRNAFAITNQLSGHFDDVVLTVPIPGQEFMVTASKDSTVRLWNLAAHAERAAYRHSRQLTAAAVSIVPGDSSTVGVVVLDTDSVATIVHISLCGTIRLGSCRQVDLPAFPTLACRLSPTVILIVCESGGVVIFDQASLSVTSRLPNLDASVARVGAVLNEQGESFSVVMLGTSTGQLLMCKISTPATS